MKDGGDVLRILRVALKRKRDTPFKPLDLDSYGSSLMKTSAGTAAFKDFLAEKSEQLAARFGTLAVERANAIIATHNTRVNQHSKAVSGARAELERDEVAATLRKYKALQERIAELDEKLDEYQKKAQRLQKKKS